MTCEKCIHRYVCATRRKFVDTLFQETAVLDTNKGDVLYTAIAEMCTVYTNSKQIDTFYNKIRNSKRSTGS
jgi:hypothetical protein